jgi:hypothetical protein
MKRTMYSQERLLSSTVDIDSTVTKMKKLRNNVNGTWWDVEGAILHQCQAGIGSHLTLQKPVYKQNGKLECPVCGATIKEPD